MENVDPRLSRRELLQAGAVLGSLAIAGPSFAAERALPWDEYARHDAVALADLVRRKQASPSELLEAAIARTEAVNGALNAVVLRHFDLARQAVRAGLPRGPLKGVPFLLKDLAIDLEGTITTNGSRFFADALAQRDSVLVERYRAAGLVIFGKTASPEFGATATTESKQWGDTHNPWKRGYSSGGSSGGAAAAVAAGILPVAHASDGGGSIRIPASNCGLFGLKPSRGRVTDGPHSFDAWTGLSIDHVISRSVRDSAVFLDASQGPRLGDPYITPPRQRPYREEVGADPGTLRIGLQTGSFMLEEIHPDCLAAAQEAAKLCASLGHTVEEIAPPPLPARELFAAMTIVMGASSVNHIQARERALGRKATPDDLELRNWESYQKALSFSAAQHEAARQDVYDFGRTVVTHQHDFDIVLSPTLAIPPPRHGLLTLSGDYESYARTGQQASAFTIQYNFSGQPAMSVPLHWNADGLPVGTMFAGRPGREDTLFRLAAQLEAAAPWADKRPTI
ncbi:MAG: amidase [Deltaproteobacteria bacterium]|nr:amidase [Deltaproteobacteria bacterium]MBW2363323.1 amidase [Deltaproteobacteria bacterium]